MERKNAWNEYGPEDLFKLEETAQILGVTRERVRQIEHHIFRRRNSYAPRKKIKEFYR